MNKFSMVAHGQIPEKLLAVVFRELHNYTVSFVQNWEQRGSGTLVDIDGVRGILTAKHVAGPLFKNDKYPIGMVIHDSCHRFEVRQDFLEHITLPLDGKDADDTDIPDISFIRLLAPTNVATIAAKRSFYPLRKRPSINLNSPLAHTALYAVGGSPLNLEKKTGTSITDFTRLCAPHFFTPAQFKSFACVGEFDYLSLGLVADVKGYPPDYVGVSGGGMWHIPLVIKSNGGIESIDYCAPELVGVVYSQSEPLPQARVIRGHGPSSIFDKLCSEIKK